MGFRSICLNEITEKFASKKRVEALRTTPEEKIATEPTGLKSHRKWVVWATPRDT